MHDAERTHTPIDATAWAAQLGVSREAVELYLASDVIDLNVESFIWTRIFGYDFRKRHGAGLFGGRFYSQVDLPRLHDAHVTGAIWSITTNPLRSPEGRARAFSENLTQLRALFASVSDRAMLVRNVAEYRAARVAGKHAAFVGIQGGNALDASPEALERLIDDVVVRITLVHVNDSAIGDTSAIVRRDEPRGLAPRGQSYVEALNARRIFVDLAHITRKGFFDAVAASDKTQPLLVTHTGASALHASRRNIDDEQMHAIANTGGVIGIIYHGYYLGGGYCSGGSLELIAEHVLHAVRTVGADHVALGSDWDGLIIPPRALRSPLELPKLVQCLLDRKLAPEAIQRILGGSFLRALALLRPS